MDKTEIEMTISDEVKIERRALSDYVNQWVPLDMLHAEWFGPEPTQVRFSDGERREAGTWQDLYCEVASWMVMRGEIDAPVPTPRGKSRFLVNSEPAHGNERFGWKYELPNGLWLEVAGNSQQVLDRTLILLKMFDLDPSSVEVFIEQRGEDGWFPR